jgi:hypothetical protein
MAGKDGNMAKTRQQLKASKAGKTTGGKPKPQPLQPGKPAGKQGPSEGWRASKQRSNDFTVHLSNKALDGDANIAKLVITAEERVRQAKPAKKKRRGLTCAQQLALAPLWQGDPAQDLPPQTEPPPQLH